MRLEWPPAPGPVAGYEICYRRHSAPHGVCAQTHLSDSTPNYPYVPPGPVIVGKHTYPAHWSEVQIRAINQTDGSVGAYGPVLHREIIELPEVNAVVGLVLCAVTLAVLARWRR